MILKIKISAVDGDEMCFPLQYNHYVQGLIYNMLDKELGEFLHDVGYQFEKRKFKMFCFSQIIGDFKIIKENGEILFKNEAILYITSPIEEFLKQLGNALLLEDSFVIGRQSIKVKEISIESVSDLDNQILIKTLSPITVYSTLYKANGNKYTCYFQPHEKEFQQLVSENLKKKYKAFYGKNAEDIDFSIQPAGRMKQHVINYKGIIIKAYSGKFVLSGNQQLLQLALQSGLGSKNSQGFGCIRMIESKRGYESESKEMLNTISC